MFKLFQEKTSQQKSDPIKLLWELFGLERNAIGVILTYEVAVGILSLTIPIGVQTVVNTLAFTQLAQPILFLAIAVLIGQVAGLVLKVTQVVILEKLQKRLFSNVGMELAYRIPRMYRESSDQLHELVNRFFDIVTIQKNLSFLILEGFSLALQILVGLVLLAFYHPALLAFDIILVLAICFVLVVLGRGAVESSVKESSEKYKVASWLEQLASKSITFSTRGARYFSLQQANQIIGDYLVARDSHFKIVLRQVIGFLSLHALANTSLLILGVGLVSANQLTIGQLVAAEIVVSTVMYSLSRFQKHLDNYYDLAAAIDKVAYLMDQKTEDSSGYSSHNLELSSFEFIDVVYDLSPLNRTVGPISFTLNKGERIMIHGSNGSGKSIVSDLIFAIRQPTSGVIKYNGMDLRQISPESLRDKMRLVRKVEIIKGSILQNIKIGSPKATLKDINKNLEILGLLPEFLIFPNGLDTKLMEDGAPLSVSQVRRLMLARALVGNPDLVIIDETIDGLDERSRAKVIEALFSKDRPWSILITSKHPDIDKHCDRIIDLDQINREQEV